MHDLTGLETINLLAGFAVEMIRMIDFVFMFQNFITNGQP